MSRTMNVDARNKQTTDSPRQDIGQRNCQGTEPKQDAGDARSTIPVNRNRRKSTAFAAIKYLPRRCRTPK